MEVKYLKLVRISLTKPTSHTILCIVSCFITFLIKYVVFAIYTNKTEMRALLPATTTHKDQNVAWPALHILTIGEIKLYPPKKI